MTLECGDLIRERDYYEILCILNISAHKTIQELEKELDEQLHPLYDDVALDVFDQYLS